MQATKKQKQLIHLNTPNRDIKEEFVQWATGSVEKTSTNDLSFEQANEIIKKLGKQPVKVTKEDSPMFWGYFDRSNKQHLQIQSLLHQIKWTMANTKYGRVPDLARFGSWLQSDRSPVRKPLKKMTPAECSKIINALNGILKTLYK
ncbi:hypothetical protein EI546_06435 [Aequorivita sp. H23M31]|uniref:Uncharacterized protein n=1 Tax=Aequorivita ciconiae TaxID=2494375 RepID=A0A410G267_9FLAO|nr:hypothetical protein [Aequorivita sp. H23M31]QAA81387.1 hypothetical protein EI546_06435 [Aequorivita sp. H23M31]